jgi:hypothetical protein
MIVVIGEETLETCLVKTFIVRGVFLILVSEI